MIKDPKIGEIWMVEGEDNKRKWQKGEIAKSRPWLVISITGHNFTCLPLSHSESSGVYADARVKIAENSYIVLNQSKTFGIQKIQQFKAVLEREQFVEILDKYKGILGHNTDSICSPEVKEAILRDLPLYPMEVIKKKYNMRKKDIYRIRDGV